MSRQLIYIANARIPTEKAHGLQIFKMCESFVRAGCQVELWLPARKNPLTADPYIFYQVEKIFNLVKLPVIDLVGRIPKLGHWLESLSFAIAAVRRLSRQPATAIIYSRDQFSLFLIGLLTKRKIYYELHSFPGHVTILHRYLWSRCRHIFCINQGVAKQLTAVGIKSEIISVEYSAIDQKDFALNTDQQTARAALGLNLHDHFLVYLGHLYPEKGVVTILEAAEIMGDQCQFLIIGGTEELVKEYRQKVTEQKLTSVRILGWKPHQEALRYLAAADALLIPNSGQRAQSANYTSPMKLFEYLASRRPIIASRVPALEEILDDSTVYFFSADNGSSLAETIQRVLAYKDEAVSRCQRAWQLAQGHTWEARAKRILSKIV